MRPSTAMIGRFSAIVILIAAPGAATLLVLAGMGLLATGPALAGVLGLAAAAALIVVFYGRDVVRITRYLRRLDRDADQPPPRLATELGHRFAGSIAVLQRRWRRRERSLTARLHSEAAIIDAIDGPILLVDDGRTVTRANDAARRTFGDQMVGRDLAGALRHPDVLAAVDRALAGGGGETIAFTRPVPVERVFEAAIKPFADLPADTDAAAPAPPADRTARPAALVTLHDITAIKRSEQMRADFVANASHELRTPLSTLAGFIETLRGPARDDEEAQDRFLDIMHQQTGRMSRLVSDLLALSDIELDEHTPPTEPVDLPRVADAVIGTLEIKARDRRMTIRLDGPGDLPPVIGDPDQLTQVFQNLIDNAINYGKPETEVTVSLAPTQDPGAGRAVAVSVRDRGDGIAKRHLPRLTERFYRVDPARSRALGGTGLGLAIVKHIVSRHRGRLTVDSTIGEGSTFTVILPVRAVTAVAAGGAARRG